MISKIEAGKCYRYNSASGLKYMKVLKVRHYGILAHTIALGRIVCLYKIPITFAYPSSREMAENLSEISEEDYAKAEKLFDVCESAMRSLDANVRKKTAESIND